MKIKLLDVVFTRKPSHIYDVLMSVDYNNLTAESQEQVDNLPIIDVDENFVPLKGKLPGPEVRYYLIRFPNVDMSQAALTGRPKFILVDNSGYDYVRYAVWIRGLDEYDSIKKEFDNSPLTQGEYVEIYGEMVVRLSRYEYGNFFFVGEDDVGNTHEVAVSGDSDWIMKQSLAVSNTNMSNLFKEYGPEHIVCVDINDDDGYFWA